MKNCNLERLCENQSCMQPNEKCSLPTLPIIPIKLEEHIRQYSTKIIHHPEHVVFDSANDQKVIPGYNFQSLFRKKSHIRMARKKNKEDTNKKNSHIKFQNSQKQTKNTQKGHWTNEQNKQYHWFLEIHNRHFIHKHLRRTDKIFKSMATFISTRQAEQCRSHHQKMEKKYRNFYQILLKLRMDFYNTANSDLLKIQLDQNGYKVRDYAIISEVELKNGDLLKNQNQYEELKSENSIKNSIEEEASSSKQQNSLLGENYQKGLDFKLKY